MVSRAQISYEFLVGIGAVLFLLLIIIPFSVDRDLELNDLREYVEKRSECLKIANIINSVYVGGDGTEASLETKYLITLYNNSLISVETIGNVTEIFVENNIAFVASEAGPTSLSFFNDINASFDPDPDWYKVCFTDLDGAGCSWSGTAWMDTYIDNDISVLMNNLGNYQTIYLEDPTMYYLGNYVQLLEDWVAQGNVLILSEHVMCRDTSSGNSCPSCYRCAEVNNGDNWNIFNITLHQRGTACFWPGNWNIEVNDTHEAYNLVIGDRMSFEERNWIENNGAPGWFTLANYRDRGCLGDSRRNPGVGHWSYGEGMIFYFGDFQVNFIGSGKVFSSGVLAELIENAYYLIINPGAGSYVTCTFSANAPYQAFTGEVIIRNQDNTIYIQNATAS